MLLSTEWNGPLEEHKHQINLSEGTTLPSKSSPPTIKGMSLLRDILVYLGRYMINTDFNIFVQTFISGTARSKVLEATQPTLYNIAPVSCPMLSMRSRLSILKYFMNRLSITDNLWVPHVWIIELLSDTGGLPRALEFLLLEFFEDGLTGKTALLENLKKYTTKTYYFDKLAERINSKYRLYAFAKKNEQLVRELIHRCICRIPSKRDELVLKSNPSRTFEDLESELHTILEDRNEYVEDDMVFVRIPFIFLHLYNKAIGTVYDEESKKHLPIK